MKTSKPISSIIIPTHDRLPYLEEAIASVQTQDQSNWECLVISDKPEEFTAKKNLIKKFNDERICFIEGLRPGANASRNLGLLHSKGKFVFYLDDDDFWKPSKLSSHIKAHEASDFVYSPVIRRYGSEKKVDVFRDEIYETHEPLNKIINFKWCPNSFSIKREIAIKEKWDESLSSYQDWDYIFRILKHSNSTFFSSHPVTIVREHTQTRSSKTLEKRIKSLEYLDKKYSNTISPSALNKQIELESYLQIRNIARNSSRVRAIQEIFRINKNLNPKIKSVNKLFLFKAIFTLNPNVTFQLYLNRVISFIRKKNMTFVINPKY